MSSSNLLVYFTVSLIRFVTFRLTSGKPNEISFPKRHFVYNLRIQ